VPNAAYAPDAYQQYYQQIMQDVSSADPLQNLAGQIGAAGAPAFAQGGLQSAIDQQQLSLLGQEFKMGTAYQQQMAGYQLGNLGLQQQQNQLQGLGLSQQQALLEGGQVGSSGWYNPNGGGLGLNKIEQQQYALGQQVYQQQATQYPEQQAEAALNYQNSTQQLQGGLGASGASNTVGGKQQQSTLTQQYGWQQQDIARAQSIAQLQNQQTQLGQQGTLAQQQYSDEQLSNAQKNLGIVSQQNGISQQEVYTQLQYAIDQAGLQMDPVNVLAQLGQLWSGIGTANAGQLAPLGLGGLSLASGTP
jgi:hypothetical protein